MPHFNHAYHQTNITWVNPDQIEQPGDSLGLWQTVTERLLAHERIPADAKANMQTVIDMARFIRANMTQIAHVVDGLAQAPQQAKCYFANDRDYHNRVLRDHRGVSLHVGNYESGQAFQATLGQWLDDLEHAVDTLLQDKSSDTLLPSLASQFQGNHLHCFEQRVSQAWSWLANYMAQQPPCLQDWLHQLALQTQEPTMEDALRFCQPAIARGELVKDDQGHQAPITAQQVVDYAQTLLCWEQADDDQLPQKIPELTSTTLDQWTQQGPSISPDVDDQPTSFIWQFATPTGARLFAAWCRQYLQLPQQAHAPVTLNGQQVQLAPSSQQALYSAHHTPCQPLVAYYQKQLAHHLAQQAWQQAS